MKKTKSQQNAINLDPTGAREKIAKNMTVMPGSPDNPSAQMNNPMNVTSLGAQNASFSGHSPNPYMEKGFAMPQMGANVINPVNVPRSPLPQNMPVGGRGFQAQQPYGMQQQPDPRAADAMEASRQNMQLGMKGMPQSAMGMTGLPAQPAPGAMPSQMPGTTGPGFMPPTANITPAGMVPGSTPQKRGQKKKAQAQPEGTE